MEGKQYEGKSLRYVAIYPDGYRTEQDYPLVILLHGFGASMHDLSGLCPAMERDGYLYVCPNAPLEFQIGPEQTGYGWTPPRAERTPKDAKRAVGMLEIFFDEVIEQYHVPPGQVILMGFSQGGAMTYRCGLAKPGMFAGLAALSSSLPEPEELADSLPAQRTQSIFIAHGIYDELAPIGRAREARAYLEREGYRPLYKEYPMGHEISQDMLNDLVPWMEGIVPPVGV